jgi:hypothetical protein
VQADAESFTFDAANSHHSQSVALSFLQPVFLWALPVALLPVLIHLIHLHRRRTVVWAATRFLTAARNLNRGHSRIRRLLILSLRVLAVATLVGVLGRPLAGGILGMTGATPQTVLVLLDRSASMQQKDLASGLSKREAGLVKLSDALQQTYRGRSRLVLIDSGTTNPTTLQRASDLTSLPAGWPTESAADIPAMLQTALDYITTNQSGRTDIWILSDLQEGDWDPSGGRWQGLRAGFTSLPGVRFHLLTYPEPAPDNLSLSVTGMQLRNTGQQPELIFDLDITATGPDLDRSATGAREVQVRILVNGTPSTQLVKLGEDGHLSLRGHTITLTPGTSRGWGQIQLPDDSRPTDNIWHFVFDQPAALRSTVIAGNPDSINPITAALEAPADPTREYLVDLLTERQIAETNWQETALIVWQIPLPAPDSNSHRRLLAHLDAGRSVLFLPPDNPGANAFLGVSWGAAHTGPDKVSWWQNGDGLLAATRSGKPLPLGELEFMRRTAIEINASASTVPLARLDSDDTALILSALNPDCRHGGGLVVFLGASVDPKNSSLARDGVVLYALLHRALENGARSLGRAQQRTAGPESLASSPQIWAPLPGLPAGDNFLIPSTQRALRAGILTPDANTELPQPGDTGLLVALNRPASEDTVIHVPAETLPELFSGLDHRILSDSLESDSPLASEIWQTFLLLMAAALLIETILTLPQPRPHPSTTST